MLIQHLIEEFTVRFNIVIWHMSQLICDKIIFQVQHRIQKYKENAPLCTCVKAGNSPQLEK